MPPRPKQSFAMFAVPFGVFMIGGWWGLAQIIQSKRELKGATSGLRDVEELDPLERMRRRYGLDKEYQPPMSSLEEELEEMKKKVDIYNFDYKPVPRTEDD